MIQLDTKNTRVKQRKLDREIQSLKKKKEALFLTPYNQDILEISEYAAKARKKFDDIVVIGIGGSILGAKTLFKALRHPYENLFKKPRMFFIDNLDPDLIMDLGDVLKKEKTLFVIASKSGETLEIIEILNFLLPILKKKFSKKWKEHIVVVTEKNKGTLYKTAEKESLKTFFIPKEIPGRFSVFTPAGLLPAALSGIDIEKLIEGTKKVKLTNIPAKLAYAQYRLNKPITVLFAYSSRFSSFAEWYKQLLGESLGKTSKIGPTPVIAIGPKDQHSILQLLVAGPKNKFVIFVEPRSAYKEFSKTILAEKKATAKVLTEKKCPNATIVLPKLDEEHMGQLMFALEAQVALCGELYKVNAFNQPGVEKVKKLTKKLLGKN
ncbi:MAG: hypothetical protein ABH856_00400 [Patescibacteria group bacterium]